MIVSYDIPVAQDIKDIRWFVNWLLVMIFTSFVHALVDKRMP